MQDRIPQKIKISQIVESQIPEYFLESNPNFADFLKQYYISQEYQGSPLDILENLSYYTNAEAFSPTNLTESTILTEDLNFYDDVISVESTVGWPKSYGLLKIDDEIITYTGITSTSFVGCIRGFCGVESLNEEDDPDNFVFLDTVAKDHSYGSTVQNLSNLFLRKFFEDFKYQYTSGFENVNINSEIDTGNLTQYVRDFYKSKGTDKSFKILFDILFGVDISITKPGDQLFTPSDGRWVENRFLIVEDLTGDVRKISKGLTLRQDARAGIGGARGITYFSTDIPKRENGKFYSKIGFDLSTLSGRFSNTAITRVTSESEAGSTAVIVDSTTGFPESGKLYVKTATGLDSFTYTSKTSTQFLGCVGLGSTAVIGETLSYGREIYEDNLLYGEVDGQNQYFAVSNIVSSIKNPRTRYLSPEDKINIKSFGYINATDPVFTNWVYNIANKYRVSSYDILSYNQCEFSLDNYSNLFKNDSILIAKTTPGTSEVDLIEGTVLSISDNIIVNFDTSQLVGVSTNNVFLRKKIIKPTSNVYSGVSNYVSNVQNTYIQGSNIYTASSCLPDLEIQTKDNSSIFEASNVNSELHQITIPDHNYYSGQVVYYECLGDTPVTGLTNKIKYFINKIDEDNISLHFNAASIYKESRIQIEVDELTSQYHKITPANIYGKTLTSQNLLKKFPIKPKPVLQKDKTPGVNGGVGLLINGVELLDSKSEYTIYYGSIENIEVKSSLNRFDVTNPPKILIYDENGSGAEANLNMSGAVREVIIDNRGFRFLADPKVKVIGGNGTGAILDARTTTFNSSYNLTFSATEGIDIAEDIVSFDAPHNLITGDSLFYSTNDQTSPDVLRMVGIGTTTVGIGTTLAESNVYYVGVVSERSIHLHYSINDAISGINTVDFTSYGVGNQIFTLNETVSVLGDVRIINGGSNYRNKRIYVDSTNYPPENYLNLSTIRTGINTYDHYIFAKNHNFNTGDLVEYSSLYNGTSIVGISTTSQYYVLKVDDNKFRLAPSTISVATTSYSEEVGVVTTTQDVPTRRFLTQGKYIKLSDIGIGTHMFKYPNIVVEISGVTAAGNTTLYQRVKCLGEIESVFLYKGGNSYGSETIFNYEKEPQVTVDSGSGATINPVVGENGSIIDYVIKRGGYNYVSAPEIVVSGIGTGAILTPILEEERIIGINIVDGGSGYDPNDTRISIIPIGYASSISASFKTNIKSWNANSFEVYKKQMTSIDDGVILPSLNSNYGNRYVNYFAPRELRVKIGDNLTKTNDGFVESVSPTHSPIIGWAYDGNPIYGPYGYTNINDSESVKRIESGYVKITEFRSDRPSSLKFPYGFFNEDYQFENTGDLDEHNGRFCITPEFPKGTYAYFSTISDINGTGGFLNSREPSYPYIIGSTFRNEVETSNYKNEWEKSLLESKDTTLFKNLTPYNSTTYEFLDLTTSPKNEIFNVKSIATSGNIINSVSVANSGSDYKVGDAIRFDQSGTGGSGVEAYVSSIVGKAVTSIVGVNTTYNNVKLDYSGTRVTGLTTIPHGLSTGQVIKIKSVRSDDEIPENDTTDAQYFKDILGLHIINVPVVTSGIVTDISSYSGETTGFTTFIEMKEGDLNKKFQVNDVVGIKSEKMLVLNVDDINDRLRVLRGYDPLDPESPASSGIAYTSGEIVELQPISFTFDLPTIRLNRTVVNRRSLYFNPSNSVGLGTTGTYATYTVGIGSTTNERRRFIKQQRLYLPNHGLTTGDKLLYRPNPGTAMSVSDSFDLSSPVALGTTVYAINRGIDFIGLSTTRVGLGSEGAGLYFVNVGAGSRHELRTNFGESLIGDIEKSYAIVSVGETHGLSENDEVSVEITPKTLITKTVRFNSKHRDLIINVATISSSEITTGSSGSALTIENHGLINGSKIIYEATSPASPLENDKEYYVIKVNDDQIRLSETLFGSRNAYEYIELTSVGSGSHTISAINPKIDVLKGNTLKFDLSHNSLSDFEFRFYEDKNFENEFFGTGTYFENSQFETEYYGNPGTSGAYSLVKSNTIIPNTLYYSIKLKDITDEQNTNKIDFYPDTEVSNYSKIVFGNSRFNTTGFAFDTDLDSYKFKISIVPGTVLESISYASTETSVLRYTTKSRSASGPIEKVDVTFGGVGYLTLPTVDSIRTRNGTGAQLSLNSSRIGSINRYEVYNSTFEIPSDYTVKPILEFPTALKIKDNFTLSSVGITSRGGSYVDAPTIKAIDNATGRIISGIEFEATLSSQTVSRVNIVQNRNDLDKNISIIAVNNGNGFIVENAAFNSSTNIVTLTLDNQLSSEQISGISTGTKIFVEGLESISGVLTTTSYNSETNNYKPFTIVGVNSVSKTVEYEIANGDPGDLDLDTSNGFMIFEKNVAKFTPRFREGGFTNGETITITKPDRTKKEFICTKDNGWNGKILKVVEKDKFSEFVIGIGDTVFGSLSNQNGKIDFINMSEADSVIDFSYVNSIGWEKDNGKLSESNQKLSDNVYYQKMSYDVKTTISPTEWKSTVDSLNHTSGFKSFGSVIIVSEPQE